MSDPFDQMRSAGELLMRRTMERVIELAVQSLDVNDLAQQIDVNALIERIDIDALLSRVDVNRVITRVDMEAIAGHTDIGAVIVMSTGSVVTEAVDIVRGQAVALDRRIDSWMRRLCRRKRPGPVAPPALLDAEART